MTQLFETGILSVRGRMSSTHLSFLIKCVQAMHGYPRLKSARCTLACSLQIVQFSRSLSMLGYMKCSEPSNTVVNSSALWQTLRRESPSTHQTRTSSCYYSTICVQEMKFSRKTMSVPNQRSKWPHSTRWTTRMAFSRDYLSARLPRKARLLV